MLYPTIAGIFKRFAQRPA